MNENIKMQFQMQRGALSQITNKCFSSEYLWNYLMFLKLIFMFVWLTKVHLHNNTVADK